MVQKKMALLERFQGHRLNLQGNGRNDGQRIHGIGEKRARALTSA